MRRLMAVVGIVILAAIGVGVWWYFRWNALTRLTPIPPAAAATIGRLPKAPAHVIVIVEENKSYRDIIGNLTQAPYINELARHGALFTHSYAVAHPSQPNYFALFAGVTNTNADTCSVAGVSPNAPNLGGELLRAGFSFGGFAEDMPHNGFTGCTSRDYARKHAPWTHFSDIPPIDSEPLYDFPTDLSRLPTVAWVIPDVMHDMHSASIARGDRWLKQRMGPVVQWAMRHDGLVIITWDESSGSVPNHIPTIFVGQMVRPGRYPQVISHYRVLRTITSFYHVPPLGSSARTAPITGVWR
jgi:hypothetical protein